ncbi:respiratory chain complex I subunit 1 family protein [Tepidibacillus sp. HK-1]|uniref:respiratory chain complex I subunit 1 family protein n=1 Tax=Tepidibacillus sp. HK-1 TaxID=1883407 RepID=UPI000853EF86|nr:NADH-quinone oxidoreductase subunit H [Tepidibacillus sp. HK-1]GBF10333.1 formate hydrogenlyase subunit 4 [Tepidibacillus sp. HK-1]
MNLFAEFVWIFIQFALFLIVSPFIQGIIKKTKARLQSRKGPSIWQGYYDLKKYFHKSIVLSEDASWITKITPYVVFTAIGLSSILVVTFFYSPTRGKIGDILVIIYLFTLARFFLTLVGLDAGSSFGGMGSSRELAVSALAEPAFILAVFTYVYPLKVTSFDEVVRQLNSSNIEWLNPTILFSFLALFIILLTETGRIPVDNPDTHLELTMIHEGMLLEFTGRHLALMTWAQWIKQMILLSIIASFFFPYISFNYTFLGIFTSFIIYFAKIIGLAILLGVVETALAKMRFYRIPRLLGMSMILSIFAFLSQYVI